MINKIWNPVSDKITKFRYHIPTNVSLAIFFLYQQPFWSYSDNNWKVKQNLVDHEFGMFCKAYNRNGSSHSCLKLVWQNKVSTKPFITNRPHFDRNRTKMGLICAKHSYNWLLLYILRLLSFLDHNARVKRIHYL